MEDNLDINVEEVIMGLIVNSGNARSLAMEAIHAAKEGDFTESDKLMKESNKYFLLAHKVQTQMIQDEINGKTTNINLLMVHAQDHLMNAVTVKDLAEEIINLYKSR